LAGVRHWHQRRPRWIPDEQDVARVSHRLTVDELEQIGHDIELIVLARAVRLHVEDRVLVHENRTVVF
jgi:formyltetrahydrofolate deformylase